MAASSQTMLDNAKDALNRLLSGQAVVEWSEGGHKVRVTDPGALLDLIERLERKVAEESGSPMIRPLVTSEALM